jgi:hypothetical protein
MRRHALIVLVALLAAVGGDLVAAQSPGVDSPGPPPAWPTSIVVIGHSGATGYDSDPEHPGIDLPENSWATGTNPDVQSIYLRVLAKEPAVEGHAFNLAIDGSDVISLVEQAQQAVSEDAAPELVLIQSIDNDIRCDGTDDANHEPYRGHLTEVMDILTRHLPSATIFFVDQWADVATYDRVAAGIDPGHLTGTGPCDAIAPGTTIPDPAKEAYLQGLVDDYFGDITQVCSAYPICRTDGGALQHLDLAPEDMASDLNHLSVTGHAKMAAIAWQALYGDTTDGP